MLDDRDHPLQAPQGLSENISAEPPAADPELLPTPSVAEPDEPAPVAGLGVEPAAPGPIEPAALGPAVPVPPGPPAPAPRPVAEPPVPPRGAYLALSLAVLGLIGFSLVLCFQSMTVAWKTPAFYTNNILGVPGRTHLLISLAVGLVLPLLPASVYMIWKRPQAGTRMIRLATLLCPLLIAGLVPALYVWEFGQRATLQYLFFLVLMVFLCESLLRISLRAWATVETPRFIARPAGAVGRFGQRYGSWLGLGSVVLAAACYSLYTGYYTIHQHRLIQTFAFDLGIYDNLMYGALKGHPFRSPVLFGPGHYNYLAGHAEYGMLLFLPFYAIHPGAETMLIMQSLMLGFAAVPLYLFARTRLSQPLSVALSFGYLLFAPLHGPNFYDFHWLPLAIFFHFWLYFALATRRKWLSIAMAIVLLAMREDIAAGMFVFGLFLALTGERVRFGVVLALVSVTWFALNKFVIMRLAGAWWFENMYSELFADGQPGYGSVFKTMLSNPTFALATLAHEPKLVYIFHLLAPLAFLPARRAVLVALLLPGFFFTLLTTGYWPTTSIAFQYTTHWIPYLFLGTTLSLWLLGRESDGKIKRMAAALTLLLALTSHSYNFGAILQRESFVGGFLPVRFKAEPGEDKRYLALMSLVKKIPRSASVAATEFLNPHISARVEAYTFRYEVPAVDYILLSRLEVSGETSRLIGNVLRKADYGLVGEAGDEFYLFKKGAPPGDETNALAKLGIRVGPREKHHH